MSQTTTRSGLKVRYHVLTDDSTDLRGLSDANYLVTSDRDRRIRKLRRWFTSLCHDPAANALYCGQTHREGNVLHRFDLATGEFTDLHYEGLAEPNEMKIHKGLWLDAERRAVFFGTASLSRIPDLIDAPGGRLVRYDIDSGSFATLGHPLAGNYIQATNYDTHRQLMYAFFEPSHSFAVWSVAESRLVRCHCVESIVHVSDLDDRGGVWGTYGHEHKFFRYDPDADRFEFPENCVMPTARAAANKMYEGAGPVDCLINGGDGYLYVASALCELYRIDQSSYEIEFLGRALPWNRLPAITIGDDGLIYGVGGNDNHTTLFRYDREARKFETLGLVAADDGEICFRPHDLVLANGSAWVAETDTPQRSGYLWQCSLD